MCMVHLIGLSLKENHTYTYARQVLLGLYIGGSLHCNILKLRFNNEIIPASGSYTHRLLRAFFLLSVAVACYTLSRINLTINK